MLNSKRRLEDLELFEELDDLVSEKISGGETSFNSLLDELSGFDGLNILKLGLKEDIDKKLLELFPQGLGNASSLSCITKDGKFDCKVSSNGETKEFNVPLK